MIWFDFVFIVWFGDVIAVQNYIWAPYFEEKTHLDNLQVHLIFKVMPHEKSPTNKHPSNGIFLKVEQSCTRLFCLKVFLVAVFVGPPGMKETKCVIL